jgi:putative addiction module CopG family antidote
MARAVKERVASGDYASESEVLREGLRALEAQEDAVERWLRTEGVARYDAWKASPHHTASGDEVRAKLKRKATRMRRTQK